MAGMYREGRTLQEVGDQFGITRERVRQILISIGVKWSDGGSHVVSLANEAKRKANAAAAKDLRRMSAYGCNQADFIRWNGGVPNADYGTPAASYKSQKHNALNCGYVWLITFPQWAQIWMESGKWGERGLARDMYVLGRKDRLKPFTADNVEVVSLGQNSAKNDWAWSRGKNSNKEAA